MKKMKLLLAAVLVSATGAAFSTAYVTAYKPYSYTDSSGTARVGCDYATYVDDTGYYSLPRMLDSTGVGNASIRCSQGGLEAVIFGSWGNLY